MHLSSFPLDDSLDLLVVSRSEAGDELRRRFRESHAFLVRGVLSKTTVVLDEDLLGEPWFTDAHLQTVLAHEYAHHLLGDAHGAGGREDEREADWLAHRILVRRGEMSAAELTEEMFTRRYHEAVADVDGEMLGKPHVRRVVTQFL